MEQHGICSKTLISQSDYEKNILKTIALMRVFPEVIVLTTKPRIDAYVLFT